MTTRIYQAIPLTISSTIQLDAEASHHLARVLRASVSDPVIVFNGQGDEYAGTIIRIDKKYVTVELTKQFVRSAESTLEIWLAQGISRGEKMDFTIQKAVELGVSKIIPLFTERCNVKLDQERSEKRLKHWQSVVISACEQSGRNQVPEVLPPNILDAWLKTIQADYCFVLSPVAEHKLKKQTIPPGARVILLIGPEGGLSEREIQSATEQGFLPLNLGPRVLRTETAALADMA
jgi:16S rRNA (uracil1498-N3)-methyltransferase